MVLDYLITPVNLRMTYNENVINSLL